MTQTELFPKTELDDANAVLNKLLADQEKAEKAVGTTEEKLSQVKYLIVRQRRVIVMLSRNDGTSRRSVPLPCGPAVQPRCWIWKSRYLAEYGELAEGETVDPVTGEIVDLTSSGEKCDASPEPLVLVWRPDAEEPIETRIGEHTTYGELIADFLAENLIDLEIADYRVIDTDKGTERDLNAVVTSDDYGRGFRIEPALASEDELAEHEADMAAEPAA